MTRFILLSLCILFAPVMAAAQFFEVQEDGPTIFYLDDHYYLTDKNCQFLSLIRESNFNYEERVFDGPFYDYDLDGHLVLEGNYAEGKKNGEFTAYHRSGHIKWETTFVDDYPEGIWHYYYPDGNPMLFVEYGERGLEITEYWDQTGRQRVKKGKGRYEMKITTTGYNEYGAMFLQKKGRVKNSKPHGLWRMDMIFEDGEELFVGFDRYLEGRLTAPIEIDAIGFEESRMSIIPLEEFVRAEFLISKNCQIDEYSGFTEYLDRLLNDSFRRWPVPQDSVLKAHFQIHVSPEGIPLKLEAVETFPHLSEARHLLGIINSITFWFPSFLEDNYIEDILDVHFDIYPDPATAVPQFFNIRINRQAGY